MNNIEVNVLNKMPKKFHSMVRFAERDSYGKYHVVINNETYGEASFHDTSFSNLMWELREFVKSGLRY